MAEASPPRRAPYVAPAVEPLGEWSTLTLQQTVPISPDYLFLYPGDLSQLG